MRIRTLAAVVAVLAVLSAGAYLVNRPSASAPEDPRVGTAVLDPATVERTQGLTVSDQGKKVALERGPDGDWRDLSYYGLPVDFEKLSRFIQDLNEAKVERFATGNPDRIAHMDFKDSSVALTDASGKEIWSVVLGKTPESGNGRYIRFGTEPKAYFSGLRVWLDTDPKQWADSRLATLKPEEVARVEVPLDEGGLIVLSRSKKDAAWEVSGAPAGAKPTPDKVSALLTSLGSLRFSDTVAVDDPAAKAASAYLRTYKLTTFSGRTLSIALGRVPEQKRPKPLVAFPAPSAKAPTPEKPTEPAVDTIPAGPVFAVVADSDAKAPINAAMQRRAFEIDEYTFTALPKKAGDLTETPKK